MTAYAPQALRGIAPFVKAYVPSAKDGGTLANKSGYHNSYNRLKANPAWRNDYSTRDQRDKDGDRDAASAADITPSDVDQRKITARLKAATDAGDERLVGKCREFGGTLDGRRVYARRIEDNVPIPFDTTHLWHVHVSMFRKYATDEAACRGVAEVMAGISATPYVWDGIEYPGESRLQIGSEGPWVTWLGQRLVAHGWTGYTSGPGPVFTERDREGVRWAQLQQGFTGADADGFPGRTTWKWLASEPSQPIPQPSYPAPTSNQVYLAKLKLGQTDSDSVWYVQAALRKAGYDAPLNGTYDEATAEAVGRWQRGIGDDVDKLLGPKQTALLLEGSGVVIADAPKPTAKPGLPDKPFRVLETSKMPGAVTYLQDFEFIPETGEIVLAQDPNKSGNTKFHLWAKDGSYKSSRTVTDGGHGQSFRAVNVEGTGIRLLTHKNETGVVVNFLSNVTKTLGTDSRPTGAPLGLCGLRRATTTEETLSLYKVADVLKANWAGRLRQVKLKKLPVTAVQQSWACSPEFVFRLSGKTAKPAGAGKATLEVFTWQGERVQTVDLTYLAAKYPSTSAEFEGLSFDGDGNLLVGEREGGTKPHRSYLVWRLQKEMFG